MPNPGCQLCAMAFVAWSVGASPVATIHGLAAMSAAPWTHTRSVVFALCFTVVPALLVVVVCWWSETSKSDLLAHPFDGERLHQQECRTRREHACEARSSETQVSNQRNLCLHSFELELKWPGDSQGCTLEMTSPPKKKTKQKTKTRLPGLHTRDDLATNKKQDSQGCTLEMNSPPAPPPKNIPRAAHSR